MYVTLGPWVSSDVKEERLYTDKDIEALILESTNEVDKQYLTEILSNLRTPGPS